jgi:hypothetical protein
MTRFKAVTTLGFPAAFIPKRQCDYRLMLVQWKRLSVEVARHSRGCFINSRLRKLNEARAWIKSRMKTSWCECGTAKSKTAKSCRMCWMKRRYGDKIRLLMPRLRADVPKLSV